MIIQAQLRQIPVTPKKMRLVVESVKHLSPTQALTQLSYLNKNAAVPLGKVLKSAINNAQNNHQLSPDKLRIKEIMVDKGWTLKRFRAAARGRAKPYTKLRSHVTIVLESLDTPKTTPQVKKVAKKDNTSVVKTKKTTKTNNQSKNN